MENIAEQEGLNSLLFDILKNAATESLDHEVVSTIATLLLEGADANAKDDQGKTLLTYASNIQGGDEIIQILIANGADILPALTLAINEGDKKALLALFKADPALSLMHAADVGNAEVVKTLLSKGVNPDLALNYAVCKGKVQAIEILVDHGANPSAPDYGGKTMLMYAADENQTESVKTLLRLGANAEAVDATGLTALMYGAGEDPRLDEKTLIKRGASDRTKIVEALLDGGCKINARDMLGRTALMYAALSHGGAEVIQTLINRGANIEATDRDNKSALRFAAEVERTDNVRVLLKNRASTQGIDVAALIEIFGKNNQKENLPQELVENPQKEMNSLSKVKRNLALCDLTETPPKKMPLSELMRDTSSGQQPLPLTPPRVYGNNENEDIEGTRKAMREMDERLARLPRSSPEFPELEFFLKEKSKTRG